VFFFLLHAQRGACLPCNWGNIAFVYFHTHRRLAKDFDSTIASLLPISKVDDIKQIIADLRGRELPGT